MIFGIWIENAQGTGANLSDNYVIYCIKGNVHFCSNTKVTVMMYDNQQKFLKKYHFLLSEVWWHISTVSALVSTDIARIAQLVEHWTVNQATRVWFFGSAGHLCCDWSWNFFYGHSHCTPALAFTEVTSSSLKTWLHCLIACPGKVRWLNCVLVNSRWYCCDLEGKL